MVTPLEKANMFPNYMLPPEWSPILQKMKQEMLRILREESAGESNGRTNLRSKRNGNICNGRR